MMQMGGALAFSAALELIFPPPPPRGSLTDTTAVALLAVEAGLQIAANAVMMAYLYDYNARLDDADRDAGMGYAFAVVAQTTQPNLVAKLTMLSEEVHTILRNK